FGAVVGDKLGAALDAHLALMRSVGWFYPFNEFVILTDRPEALHVDARGLLHNELGAALRYRDGYTLHAVHGLRVPADVIETPAVSITRDRIAGEQNAELRRIMLDRYAGRRGSEAIAKWLADSALKPIDAEDITAKMQPPALSLWRAKHGDEPVLCRLYRCAQAGDEDLVMLMVVCTSTAHEVPLRVPPTIKSAAEGRAWTFNYAADKFQPALET
ncbi:MAG: hypothetical protein KGL39_25335, partial [Patescibacteria group bacterium]|nr:hypothetical protein [Patescibacteria group bacterium]